MFDELWRQGVNEGLGIFFFLFLAMAGVLWYMYREAKRDNSNREKQLMEYNREREKQLTEHNREREERFENTLSELLKSLICLEELRRENAKGHDDTHRMVARILDRMPPIHRSNYQNGNWNGSDNSVKR